MKRIIPLLALLLFMAVPAYAQEPDIIGEVVIPDGDGLAPDAPAQPADDDDSSRVEVVNPDGDGAALESETVVLPSVSNEDAVAAVRTLLSRQGGWGVLAAAVLTLMVFMLRKSGALSRVPSRAIPWVAAFLAMTTEFLAAVASDAPLADALIQGFLLGAAAVGFWEMAVKHVVRRQEPANAPLIPSPPA